MRRRSNPWPAFSDLFLVLMLLMLGLAMVQSKDLGRAGSGQSDPVREAVNELSREIQWVLEEHKVPVSPCADDTNCLDLGIRYSQNGDEIEGAEQREALSSVCKKIKAVMDRSREFRDRTLIIIEGHTDWDPVKSSDPKYAYVGNWDLSARRVQSVLYEFAKCGLTHPEYRFEIQGYADSRPKCVENGPCTRKKECKDASRRTTLKIKVDYESLSQAQS